MDQNTSQHIDPVVDNVTREQGGQFIDEGSTTYRPNLEEAALGGEGDVQLHDRDSPSVNALQVNMERSGADYVNAQRSFLTNSGAREIHSDSAKLTQSGVLSLHADSAEFKQSSAVMANAKTITLHESSAVMANAEKVQVEDASRIGWMNAGNVDANGDVRSFMIMAGNIKAGGNVTTTLDAKTAGMAAAIFGVVVVLFSRLLGRK